MKLKWLQNGTFDTKYGEYEWIYKVCFILLKEKIYIKIIINLKYSFINSDMKWNKDQEEDFSFNFLFLLLDLLFLNSLYKKH